MSQEREWDVYVDGHFVGTVFANRESEARLAALSTFDPSPESDISVNPR